MKMKGYTMYIHLFLEEFEPLLILYAFKAKFLLLKLCCHAQFNVYTFALVQSKCMINTMYIVVMGISLGYIACFCPTFWCNSNRNN